MPSIPPRPRSRSVQLNRTGRDSSPSGQQANGKNAPQPSSSSSSSSSAQGSQPSPSGARGPHPSSANIAPQQQLYQPQGYQQAQQQQSQQQQQQAQSQQGARPGSGFVQPGQQAKGAAQAPSIVVSNDNVRPTFLTSRRCISTDSRLRTRRLSVMRRRCTSARRCTRLTRSLSRAQAVMPQDPLPHPSSSPHHPVPGGPQRTSAVPFPTSSVSPPPGTAAATAAANLSHALHGGPTDLATPPKVQGGAGKLKGTAGGPQGTPKDTIPMARTPRKQRSSRVHVTEKVELERLPGFLGASPSPCLESPPERPSED